MNQRLTFLFDLFRSAIGWFLVGFLTFIFYPMVLIYFLISLSFDSDRKHVHPVISAWAKSILTVYPMMRVRIEGADHIQNDRTYVLVANHQSVADIIAVLHLSHPFKFIAKHDLFWIPFFGWSLLAAGYIPLIRGNHESGKVAALRARGFLERGVSVLFFPEGTRSRDGQIQTFKPGAFKLAVELNIPVVPIVIEGTRDLLPKGSRILARRAEVLVQIGAPRYPGDKETSGVETLLNEVRLDMIHSLEEIRSRRNTNQADFNLIKA